MKKIIKLAAGLLVTVIVISVFFCMSVTADGASMYINKSSVSVGDTFTVTCRFDSSVGLYYFNGKLSFSTSTVQYVSGGGNVSGNTVIVSEMLSGETSYSFSATFKTVAAGNVSLYFEGSGSDGESEITRSTSYAFSTSTPSPQPTPDPEPPTASGDANLVSLSVSDAVLTPAFNKSVTNYTATVKYPVEKATLSVTAASGATFVGTGTFDLEVGNNSHTVTVTAADKKTKKSYTVNIRRMTEEETKQAESGKAEDPLSVRVDGKALNITPNIASLGVFEGYAVEKVKRGATEVEVLKDKAGRYTLYYMTDAEGKGNYYNAVGENTFEKVNTIISGIKLYIVNPLPKGAKLPKEYVKTTLKTDKGEMPAVKFKDKAAKDIYIVFCYYNGKNGYYRYDSLDKTVSRAPEFASILKNPNAEKSKSEPEIIVKVKNISTAGKIVLLLMVLGFVGIVLIVIFSIVSVKRKKRAYGHVIENVSVENPKELSDTAIVNDANYTNRN